MESKIKESINKILGTIDKYKILFKDEKDLQNKLEKIFIKNGIEYNREYHLEPYGIVDFFIDNIAVEVKIAGQKRAIHRQCKEYAKHDDVKAVVLVASISMGLPPTIEGKPSIYYRLNWQQKINK